MANSERYDIASGKGVLFLASLRQMLKPGPFDAMMDEFGRSHAGKAATTDEFIAAAHKAHMGGPAPLDGKAKIFNDAVESWLDGTGLPTGEGLDWSIDAFGCEPDKALIVYGTLRDIHAQKEAASILQDRIARRWGNYTVVIKSDVEVAEDELKANHLLLIGRPGTNKLADRFADSLSVKFGPGSFQVGKQTYANAGSAIVTAGANPLAASRYSLVVFSGLGAESTRECVSRLFDRGSGPSPAVLMPAGGQPRPILIAPKNKPANVAEREE